MDVKKIAAMTAEELREIVTELKEKHDGAVTDDLMELKLSCLTHRERSDVRLNMWLLTNMLELRAGSLS